MDTYQPDGAACVLVAQLPDRLRHARRIAGLSQAALAVRVGICGSAVAQWEQRDGTSPRVEHLARVACVCGVAFEWLATGRGPMTADGIRVPEGLAPAAGDDPVERRLLASFRRLRRRKREHVVRWIESIR